MKPDDLVNPGVSIEKIMRDDVLYRDWRRRRANTESEEDILIGGWGGPVRTVGSADLDQLFRRKWQ